MGVAPNLHQTSLPGLCPIEAAVAEVAMANAELRGAVFTRREVVDFILDLVGYTEDQPLHLARILEPATGHGDFLIPTIERLFGAYKRVPADQKRDLVSDLGHCIRSVELHLGSYKEARRLVLELLLKQGASSIEAEELCGLWLLSGDYLLLPMEAGFTHIVGNPPYIRQELIPDALMTEYRRRYSTIYDRADIYVPFIERSLALLAPTGKLGFICADRWMKNKYGGPLRKLIASQFHLHCYVDMVDTEAFHSDVIAYPAIIVVGREKVASTRIAARPEIDGEGLKALAAALTNRTQNTAVREVALISSNDQPWMLEDSERLSLVRRLEATFPAIESVGCKIGIGVATGADQVFIGPYDKLDVEADRKLPLAMTKDIQSGSVKWRGLGVINPFADNGRLVDLKDYPKLAAYLDEFAAAVKARHVSKRNPSGWYRTIDRIYPALARVPKLLIPDIKGEANIVYEDGQLYPHHNLYYVTSDIWDLHALQAILLSDITKLFIELYSTKMRGGYLRFQAQYLRRLRLPAWDTVEPHIQTALIEAGCLRHKQLCNEAASLLYRLTGEERRVLLNNENVSDAA